MRRGGTGRASVAVTVGNTSFVSAANMSLWNKLVEIDIQEL